MCDNVSFLTVFPALVKQVFQARENKRKGSHGGKVGMKEPKGSEGQGLGIKREQEDESGKWAVKHLH